MVKFVPNVVKHCRRSCYIFILKLFTALSFKLWMTCFASPLVLISSAQDEWLCENLPILYLTLVWSRAFSNGKNIFYIFTLQQSAFRPQFFSLDSYCILLQQEMVYYSNPHRMDWNWLLQDWNSIYRKCC